MDESDVLIARGEGCYDFDFSEVDRKLGSPEPLPGHVDRDVYLDAVRQLGQRLDSILEAMCSTRRGPRKVVSAAMVAGLRIALGNEQGASRLARDLGVCRATISFWSRRYVETLGLSPAIAMRSESTVRKNTRARVDTMAGRKRQTAKPITIPKDRLANESEEMRQWLDGLSEAQRAEAEAALAGSC